MGGGDRMGRSKGGATGVSRKWKALRRWKGQETLTTSRHHDLQVSLQPSAVSQLTAQVGGGDLCPMTRPVAVVWRWRVSLYHHINTSCVHMVNFQDYCILAFLIQCKEREKLIKLNSRFERKTVENVQDSTYHNNKLSNIC